MLLRRCLQVDNKVLLGGVHDLSFQPVHAICTNESALRKGAELGGEKLCPLHVDTTFGITQDVDGQPVAAVVLH